MLKRVSGYMGAMLTGKYTPVYLIMIHLFLVLFRGSSQFYWKTLAVLLEITIIRSIDWVTGE